MMRCVVVCSGVHIVVYSDVLYCNREDFYSLKDSEKKRH